MSESWRRRNYYRPRVLIGASDTLENPYPGGLFWLSGADLNIIRNLLQYATRRANWVSEYHEQFYLVPDVDDWDTLQAIVAELEETLMAQQDIEGALLEIASQIQCICSALQSTASMTQPPDEGYTEQPYYDDYTSPVVEDEGDPPGEFPTWDAWRTMKCKAAQKVIDDVGSSVIQMGEKLAGGILITFSVINGLLLLSVISIPVSIVSEVVTVLVALGATMAFSTIAGWLADNKQSLVCAIYTAPTASAARAAVLAAINDNWDCGAGKQIVVDLFNYRVLSDVFDGTVRNYDEWEGGYSDEFCAYCEELPPPEGFDFEFEWPPCPNGYFWGCGVCWNGHLNWNGTIDPGDQEYILTGVLYTYIDVWCDWYSCFDTGWTVGNLKIQWWQSGTGPWSTLAQMDLTNLVDAAGLNQKYQRFNVPTGAGLFRVLVTGQPAQDQTEPYPMELVRIRVLHTL
jgi:hypothetical protein